MPKAAKSKKEPIEESETSEDCCEICCEAFTKNRYEITCCMCDISLCATCVKKYLVASSQEAHCMACKKAWSKQFLFQVLTKSWLTGDYRKSRQKLYLDREKSLLPATMPIATAIINAEKERAQLYKELEEIRRQDREICNKIIKCNEIISGKVTTEEKISYMFPCSADGCKGFIEAKTWKCGLCETKVCKSCHMVKEKDHECNKNDVKTAKMIVKDTKPCPTCKTRIYKIEGCFGKNTQILMGDGSVDQIQNIDVGDHVMGDDGQPKLVEESFSGTDNMYRVIGEQTEYVVSEHHTLVLAKFVPYKKLVEIPVFQWNKLSDDEKAEYYGAKQDGSIYRMYLEPLGQGEYFGIKIKSENHRFLLADNTVVRNCSQMFCTNCHSAWDWNTGEIETKNIHNPHYFELQRKMGFVPRTRGDMVCGGLNNRFLTRLGEPYYTTFREIVQRVGEVEARINRLTEKDFLPLRIEYLRGEISDKIFQANIFRVERNNEKIREERQILETFRVSMIERLNDLSEMETITNDILREKKAEVDQIVEFCNTAFKQNYLAMGLSTYPRIDLKQYYGNRRSNRARRQVQNVE